MDLNASLWTVTARGALLAATLAGLCACGGGSSATSASASAPGTSTPSSCTASSCGGVVVSVTDAAGDFLSYQVGLTSLRLKKADGTLVETLPTAASADFTQLIDLSEILSSHQVPPGEYIAAELTVDYRQAAIQVDDGNGNAVTLSPVDAKGAAISTLALRVNLDNKNHLNLSAGKVSRLAFDFNLRASNMVDLGAKTVTVSPVLIGSVVAPDNKPLRVRGDLSTVDTAAGTYIVAVQPFHEHGDDHTRPLVVHTTADTAFEIDGTPYSGASGLAKLADLPAGTLTAAYGQLASADTSFTARRVLAGTSLEGSLDHLTGTVVARRGNLVTVRGVHQEDHEAGDDHEGHEHYVGGRVALTLADATVVTVDGQTAAAPAHGIADISVGSHIDAYGTADRSTPSFDASAGRVRLGLTQLKGTLGAKGASQLTLALASVDRQPVSYFDFTDTGSTAGAYRVATGTLSLDAFASGDTLLAIGRPAPVGGTPPDFSAVTLAAGGPLSQLDDDHGHDAGDDHGNDDQQRGKQAQLDIDWGKDGTDAAFSLMQSTQLVLDVHNGSIDGHHRIQVDPQDLDVRQLASDIKLEPGSGMTLFTITGQHGRQTDIYYAFADFETALADDLGAAQVLRVTADGDYDTDGNVFTATRITVLLSE